MDRHTFLAVPIPLNIQSKIHDYANEVRPLVPLKKWTSVGDYHITLEFLGSTPEKKARKLIDEMEDMQVGSFNLTLNTFGFFGNPKTPKVFWIGVDPSEKLNQLHQQVQQYCSASGFDISTRPFSPHITLGKRWGGEHGVFSPKTLPDPEKLKDQCWEVEEAVLYEIHPQREQKYVTMARFPLGKGTE